MTENPCPASSFIAPAAPPAATLEQFLAGLGTRAFRFAEVGLRNREDALDAVQEAMMKMMIYQSRPAADWTPLFWSILRRKIVDLQRRSNARLRWLTPGPGREESTLDWAEPGAGPAQVNDQREAYSRLVDALRALPRRQREAFTLRILEELDVTDTARAMGCSEGSVKTHLSRARSALRKHLEEFA